MDDLRKLIREVPDYPKPGILFYDLTTLLKDKSGFHALLDRLCNHYAGRKVDVVVGIEARGFIFAPALAYRLGAGFVPVRKPKKLPAKITQVCYQLEYGTDTLEIHQDSIQPGESVIISDDLLATGAPRCDGAVGAEVGWCGRRSSLRRGINVFEGPRETARFRCFFAAAVRPIENRRRD